MSTSTPGLGSAIGWAYAMDIGSRVLGAVVTFVLAALLGPEDFGLVAIAAVYVMFIEMVQRQGMSSAIVQRRDLEEDHLHTAFWMIAGLSLGLTAVSIGLSGWWADLNNTVQLQPVIVWMSALLPVQGLILVQEAILRREMRFRPLAVRNTVASVVGGVLGVAAALAGFGVWALVVQQLSTAVTKLCVLWFVADWSPRLRFSSRHMRDLLSFSTGSFLTGVGVFVNSKADALFVGMFFGPAPIGLYRFAQGLMTQVSAVSLAGPSMITVALPALSQRQHALPAFSHRLRGLVHIAVVSSVPLFGILAAIADPLLRIVGDQWLPAVPAVQLLCVAGSVNALASLVQPVLQALGHPHRQAVLTWAMAAFSVISFIAVGFSLQDAGLMEQVTLLAMSRAGVYLVALLPTALYVYSRYGDLPVPEVLRICSPAVLSGLAAWLVGTSIAPLVRWQGGRLLDIASLAVVGLCASLVAGAILLTMDKRARDLLTARAQRLRRRFMDDPRPTEHEDVPSGYVHG